MLWALGAIVAVLIIVSMTNTTTTGNALFDFLKKDKVEVQPTLENTYQGILAEKGLDKEALKGYEVKYDVEGNLIYEISTVEGTEQIFISEEYNLKSNQINFIGEKIGGTCVCGATETNSCNYESTEVAGGTKISCTGSCSTENGVIKKCKVGTYQLEVTKNSETLFGIDGEIAYIIEKSTDEEKITPGEGYRLKENPLDENEIIIEKIQGNQLIKKACGCKSPTDAGSSCSSSCIHGIAFGESYCSGTCSGDGCSSNSCGWISNVEISSEPIIIPK